MLVISGSKSEQSTYSVCLVLHYRKVFPYTAVPGVRQKLLIVAFPVIKFQPIKSWLPIRKISSKGLNSLNGLWFYRIRLD